jgi:predicted Fe-Mo cluster-binding NifX family protein
MCLSSLRTSRTPVPKSRIGIDVAEIHGVKIAIPVWNDHVSPVFDVARCIRIWDTAEASMRDTTIEETPWPARARVFVELGINTVICGAISAAVETLLCESGIVVVTNICGRADEIARTYASGDRRLTDYRSPGSQAGRPSMSCRGRPRPTPKGTRK